MDSHEPASPDAGSRGGAGGALASGPVEQLAAECIARRGAGEAVDVDAVAARLTSDDERRQLRELLDDAQRIQGLLPTQVRPGLLLAKRYHLLREIGSGGMGKVYEALDSQLERRVAVKVLTAVGAASFDPEQLFMQEAVLLASLQHPNIVAVHELGEDGDITFIVMDLVQGTAASEVLERVASTLAADKRTAPRHGRLLEEAIGQQLPAGRASLIERDSWFRSAARIVLEVTRTIEEAHGKGVIHRDIKPHNILLRGDGSPVILDFGLAGTLDRVQGSITRGLFGTVGYIAPEQVASGRIGADRRTDVYQLGLLLYEFLTLKRAFPGDQITTLLARISRGDFHRPRAIDPGIPFELDAICLKAMELDPARRYATATALREDLQRFLDGSEVPLAARGGAVAAAARASRYWVRRHKPSLAIGLTLAAALLAVLIALRSAPAAEADVKAFRFRDSDKSTVFAPDARSVRPDDVLGVKLEAATPQYIYALSAFGTEDPPTFLAPMRLVLLGESREHAEAVGTWGRRLQPGASTNCTHISESSEVGSSEGLWIFSSATEQPQLEAWMKRLSAIALASANHAVPFAEAHAAFDANGEPSPTRGDQVHLSSAELAEEARSLDAASVLGEKAWPFTGARRASFFFRVER